MPFVFMSHSLRQILPRKELREIDRRSGAYPVKSKTGDRTRTGRNNVYFDDTRTVMFLTGVNVTYPTTLQANPAKVAYDLTCSIGDVVGNVDKFAVEQFIPHRDQVEGPGPFVENKLFEQDEHGVVNSNFMTGAAFAIAPDRFKSGLSSKTILRMEFPLHEKSTLSSISSSIAYFNPTRGAFETVVQEKSFNLNGGRYPNTYAPIIFTPYGFHYLPLNDQRAEGGSISYSAAYNAKSSYKRITTYAGDGSDGSFYGNQGYGIGYVTSSVLNPKHTAAVSQSIALKTRLSSPFLLEKIVVEFPFEAGPGWLNDCYGVAQDYSQGGLATTTDGGGPMITFALLRQDKAGTRARDVIASGTITTLNDMQLGNYKVYDVTFGGGGQFRDVVYTHEGVGAMLVNPSIVITGSAGLSGSNNFFTGTLKMTLEPAVTTHVQRQRVSGALYMAYNAYGFETTNFGNTIVRVSSASIARFSEANGLTYGPIARRSAGVIESGRSVLGNHFALIEPDALDGSLNPVHVVDNQYESLTSSASPKRGYGKVYTDVVSKTTKSPYLLYPDDDIILSFSKHRAAAADGGASWDYFSDFGNPKPVALTASHDVGIGTGLFKVTLYGDLIKEDHEYHDTLNQRLETVELWENIGEDPVLDQFDVAYRNELSGSYIDRFNVANVTKGMKLDLSSSLFVSQYYSNFMSDGDSSAWSPQFSWSRARRVSDLKKSGKNVNHQCGNEKYWDCRVPDPYECIYLCNPNVKLGGYDITETTVSFMLYTGDSLFLALGAAQDSNKGIKDWMMTYPYEQRYKNVSPKFSDSLVGAFFSRKDPGSAGVFRSFTPYRALSIELGHSSSNGSLRQMGSEVDTNFSLGHTGLTHPEFIKAFYGIGNGRSNIDNQHVTFRASTSQLSQSVVLRGWRYGMMSAFPLYSNAVYRRDRFGQPRDMLEQRLDAVFFDEIGLSANGNVGGVIGTKDGPVQVKFYDRDGNITPALRTLSSNVSAYATSSMPYTDGLARNRPAYDDDLNILSITT